eukprot:PITA_31972
MEECRGGSSPPSYKNVVASRGKSPLGKVRDSVEEKKSNNEKETNEGRPKENAHREHMGTYTIICKFMGLWPMEKALQLWIKYHWKPKGSIDLHLGSKGFFTVVFTNIEDKDRIFEGGPYFYAAAGLYMWPWKMNFVPERETFTSVLVWVRLYSLPLDYWQTESLAAIGNKLGNFVKASEATRRGKYTSYARIYVEMDLS